MRRLRFTLHLPVTALLLAGALSACDGGAVMDPVPGVPAMQHPANGSEQQNAIELRWAEDPGATLYHVQFTEDGQFDDVGLDAKQVDSGRMTVNELTVGSTYWWRVRAKNESGLSEWSQPWSFDVVSEAPKPGEVELVWPPDGQGHVPRSLILTWDPADLAEMYHVQVSQEPAFLRMDADLNTVVGESQGIYNLDSTYVYFWRVRSRNLAGYGPWSPTWSFVVEAAEGWVPGT